LLGAGNVKRVLEIFRGIRNLSITNDTAYGIKISGKARRGKPSGQRPKLDQVFSYTAVTEHRDIGGKRQYKILWGDGALSWEPADSFQEDALRSEGKQNAVTKYLQTLSATASARPQERTATWQYTAIVDHKDDHLGARAHYQVQWGDDGYSWEPVSQFTVDVEKCEGKNNT